MTPLRTSDLRYRIVIRRPSRASDGKGGYTTSWETIAEPMAEVKGQDGRESVMEKVLEGISVYRIRIRWRRGLEVCASDQVRLPSGLELNIKAPAADPDGKREQLLFMAETGSARRTS